MEKLNQTLRSYLVGPGEADTKDKILVASFLVMDKNGNFQTPGTLTLLETRF
jgi:hypothetical protein